MELRHAEHQSTSAARHRWPRKELFFFLLQFANATLIQGAQCHFFFSLLHPRHGKSAKLYPSAHRRAAAAAINSNGQTTHPDVRGDSFMKSADPVISLVFLGVRWWGGGTSRVSARGYARTPDAARQKAAGEFIARAAATRSLESSGQQ